MDNYIEHIKSIVDALSVEKEPVGVKYTDEDPAVEIEAGSYTVCGAILAASEGKVILLSEESCACFGGKTYEKPFFQKESFTKEILSIVYNQKQETLISVKAVLEWVKKNLNL